MKPKKDIKFLLQFYCVFMGISIPSDVINFTHAVLELHVRELQSQHFEEVAIVFLKEE